MDNNKQKLKLSAEEEEQLVNEMETLDVYGGDEQSADARRSNGDSCTCGPSTYNDCPITQEKCSEGDTGTETDPDTPPGPDNGDNTPPEDSGHPSDGEVPPDEDEEPAPPAPGSRSTVCN